MADDKPKDPARELRLTIVRALGLGERFHRTHTPTGVFRRKDVLDHTQMTEEERQAEEDKPRHRIISARSLANLQKRRSRS